MDISASSTVAESPLPTGADKVVAPRKMGQPRLMSDEGENQLAAIMVQPQVQPARSGDAPRDAAAKPPKPASSSAPVSTSASSASAAPMHNDPTSNKRGLGDENTDQNEKTKRIRIPKTRFE